MKLLTDLKQQTGKTLILVTHDPSIAARCDRTVYMVDGNLSSEAAIRDRVSHSA
jgi:putative ABC transport system ATP-binding protein